MVPGLFYEAPHTEVTDRSRVTDNSTIENNKQQLIWTIALSSDCKNHRCRICLTSSIVKPRQTKEAPGSGMGKPDRWTSEPKAMSTKIESLESDEISSHSGNGKTSMCRSDQWPARSSNTFKPHRSVKGDVAWRTTPYQNFWGFKSSMRRFTKV